MAAFFLAEIHPESDAQPGILFPCRGLFLIEGGTQ